MAYNLQKMKTSLENNRQALKTLGMKIEQKIEPTDVAVVEGFIFRVENLHKLLEMGKSSNEAWSPRESARAVEIFRSVMTVAEVTDINKEAGCITKLFPEKYQGEARLITSQIKNNYIETLAELERLNQQLGFASTNARSAPAA